MSPGPASRSHEEFARVLRRVGYPDEVIREVLSQLPDPIDIQRDQADPRALRLGPRTTNGSSWRQSLTRPTSRDGRTRMTLTSWSRRAIPAPSVAACPRPA